MQNERPDAREYLAAERTLLSYIRTAMGMIGLGFVIARFGVMLHDAALLQGGLRREDIYLSVIVGTSLVFVAAAVTILAAVQYRIEVKQLNIETDRPRRPSWLAIAISLMMCAVAVGVGVYLLGTPGLEVHPSVM